MEDKLLAGDLLDAARGGAPAIEFEGAAWSHAELDRRANRFAHWFQRIGLKRGDRVSLLVGNEPALVAAYFGAFRAGVIANPVNTRLTPPEIAYVLNHAGSACVIVSAELMPAFDATRALLEGSPQVLALAQDAAVQACDDGPVAAGPSSAQDGALLIYTSGTTGKPKGVLLSHGNVVAAVRIVSGAFEISPLDRTMCVMPLFHTNALMFSHLPFLHAGAAVLLRRRFSATTFWSDCRASRANSASASPTILALLLAHEEKGPPRGESGLEYIKVASAPTPVELAERFEARFGKGLLLETFGLTETTAITTMNPLHAPRKFGSIGQVVPPQELRIVDDEGNALPADRAGEIAIAGPTVMREYFRDPENTQRAMRGRWFQSGDIARMDAEGFVFIVGRKKEMILRGGENISPLEVEQIAQMHPGVREAAAVGLPDPIWGEVVGLCVVADAPLSSDDVAAFCRGHLSAFKVPERIMFVDTLPRNAMGKVLRARLREAFQRAGEDAIEASGTEKGIQ
jgi:acyl-CoA synthetase (AMP-forming)/AMP-acid ligase II